MSEKTKKQPKVTSVIKGTIEFSNVYEPIQLQNALYAILKGDKLDDDQKVELQKLFGLIESMTGNDFLSYLLKNHK